MLKVTPVPSDGLGPSPEVMEKVSKVSAGKLARLGLPYRGQEGGSLQGLGPGDIRWEIATLGVARECSQVIAEQHLGW